MGKVPIVIPRAFMAFMASLSPIAPSKGEPRQDLLSSLQTRRRERSLAQGGLA
jgi:hypothetical protein